MEATQVATSVTNENNGAATPWDDGTKTGPAWTVISPHRGWFDWRLGQLWRYRDLIGLFVWRDFVAVYKQTILGPGWHIVQPVVTTLIFTLVFGRIAGLSTEGTPPFLFYMAGYIAWTYFASCLDNTSKTFVANAPLLGKVYFHRLVIPVSLVISNLISFGIQFGVFLTALIIYAISGGVVHLNTWALLTPIFLLMLAGYGLGGGIMVCALTTRYRDLRHLVTFGVQLLLYLTPVIYPISAVPARYRWLAQINPLTPVIEGFRLGFLGVGSVTIEQLAVSFGTMLLALTAGLMLFSHVERTFMDTV
jgi:homopolymeric O-antigen transport system permease protein